MSTNRFASLLHEPSVTMIPSCYDALSARVAEVHGFPAVAVSGYDVGAALGVTEPILTASEVVAVCTSIKRVTDLALVVDVGAGFGEPIHARRAVADLALVGVDAVHIEDQIYPKRAHYFADYQEHLIPLEHMLDKIRTVREACGDGVALIGRTDAFATSGEKDAVRRIRAFVEAGVDAVMAFPRNWEEAERLPRATDAPVIYVNTHGNRVDRPILSVDQAQAMGYRALLDAHTLLFAGFDAMESAARLLAADEEPEQPIDAIAVRRRIEQVLRVPELIDVEAATVERGS